MPEPTTATAGGAAILGAGFVGWLVKMLIGREIKRVDEHLASHAKSISELQTQGTKTVTEVAGVRESIAMMRGEQSQAHMQFLNEIRGVHARLDRVLEQRGHNEP